MTMYTYNMSLSGVPFSGKSDIPQNVWDFFDSEPGLSTAQLTHAVDVKTAKYPFNDLNFTFHIIDVFGGYDLIRYYRDHEGFSEDSLLQYDGYAIRDFIVHDKEFLFHDWILKNKLKIPDELTQNHWSSIFSLTNSSGIEYLNRKVLSKPKSERQATLNAIASLDSCRLYDNIKVTLNDCLVKECEVSWNTIQNRFEAFQNRQNEKHTDKFIKKPTSYCANALFSPVDNEKQISDEQMRRSDFGRASDMAKRYFGVHK